MINNSAASILDQWQKQEGCLEDKFFSSLDFQGSNKFNNKKRFVRDWILFFVCKE